MVDWVDDGGLSETHLVIACFEAPCLMTGVSEWYGQATGKGNTGKPYPC